MTDEEFEEYYKPKCKSLLPQLIGAETFMSFIADASRMNTQYYMGYPKVSSRLNNLAKLHHLRTFLNTIEYGKGEHNNGQGILSEGIGQCEQLEDVC